MKSSIHGTNISGIEVTTVTKHGIWLFVNEREYLLPFDDFPWFKEAKIDDIYSVKLLHSNHLYWEKLDIDLEVDQLTHPEKYPLVYKA